MASRRILKKCIKSVSIDLVSECYVRYIFNPEKEKEVNEIVSEINKTNYDLVTRIAHTDGKNNRKITKAYYKKIAADWHDALVQIIDRINALPMK